MNRLRFVVVGALLVSAAGTTAASEKARWQIGGRVVAGMPQGAFRDSIDDTRWGGAVLVTRRYRDTPLRFGGELGLLVNGSVDITLRPIEIDNRFRRDDLFSEDASLTNDIYFARFVARLQPAYGRWSPFVEGVAGLQGFETSVVLEDCFGPCTVSTPTSSTTFSVGGGGGIRFRLTKDDPKESGFSLELGARYLFGGETEFFLPDDLPALGNNQSPIPQRSRTNMVTVTFGFVFDF